jgi:hypothetical protein
LENWLGAKAALAQTNQNMKTLAPIFRIHVAEQSCFHESSVPAFRLKWGCEKGDKALGGNFLHKQREDIVHMKNEVPSKDETLLAPLDFRALRHEQIDAMLEMRWSQADIEMVFRNSEEKANTFFNLPLHLQTVDYIISTDGKNVWRWAPEPTGSNFGLIVPGNTIVYLGHHEGEMEMGWGSGKRFDPRGWTGGQPWPELPNSKFLNREMNRYCFLVKIGDHLLTNKSIANLGASLDSMFLIATDQGGRLYTAFNDEDSWNNHGYYNQIIQWQPIHLWTQRHLSVLRARARK